MKLLILLFSVVVVISATGPLNWPDQYYAEGTIYLPYSEIVEPFTAVVDMKSGRSKLTYYDGVATVMNLGGMGTYGTMYKIVPETTQDFANRLTCFKIPGAKDAEVAAQGVLPDTTDYKYVGDYTYNDIQTSVYTSSFSEGSKDNNYTILVNKDNGFPVLLRFVGFDRLFGSHYDEYIFVYQKFSKTIDPSSFNISVDNCISFPGPGITLPMADNPMFQFVGAVGYEKKHHAHMMENDFITFKHKHGHDYDDAREEIQRKVYFHHNHRYIESMNRKNIPYKLKMNHLTDYSDSEIKMMRGYRYSKDSPKGEIYYGKKTLQDMPDFFNWRLRGAVTPVKDQGICGSCWSFGTTGTIEGSYFLKHKKLIQMSEQALVDCSWGYGNNGCDGGESERAYQWIIDNGCIPSEETYGQYLMQDGKCKVNQSICGASLSRFYNTPSGDVSALVSAIYEKGPISVAIDASHKSFSFYSHGVYYEPQCGNGQDDLDHQVLTVGYGNLEPGNEFWLVKNSWSTHWGMDGYILMSRNGNNCGVATDASYAEII